MYMLMCAVTMLTKPTQQGHVSQESDGPLAVTVVVCILEGTAIHAHVNLERSRPYIIQKVKHTALLKHVTTLRIGQRPKVTMIV